MSFISYLVNGLSLGSVYALIALGYTMVYGIAKMLYLVGAAAPDLCLQISCLKFIDRFLQLLDWVCYPG